MNDPDRKALFITNGGSRHIGLTELPSDKETDRSGYYVEQIHSHTSEKEKRGYVCLCKCNDMSTMVMPSPDGINLIG